MNPYQSPNSQSDAPRMSEELIPWLLLTVTQAGAVFGGAFILWDMLCSQHRGPIWLCFVMLAAVFISWHAATFCVCLIRHPGRKATTQEEKRP